MYCLASDDYVLHFEVYEGKEDHPSAHGVAYCRVGDGIQGCKMIIERDAHTDTTRREREERRTKRRDLDREISLEQGREKQA